MKLRISTVRARGRAGALAAAVAAVLLVPPLAVAGAAASSAAGVTCHLEWAPMRDGVKLATEVYLPAAPGRYPVLLTRSPYNYSFTGGAGSNCNNPQYMQFAAAGYAALNQDVRGTYRSQGVFDPIVQERNDGYDAVEWAARQPWSDGKVGMFGGSYVGLTQWQAAIARPPHLVTIVPDVTAANYENGWTYQGGAFELWFGQSWIALTFAVNAIERKLEAEGASPAQIQAAVAAFTARADASLLTTWDRKLPLVSFSAYRTLAPYYYTWLKHPSLDSYWLPEDVQLHYAQLTIPTLSIGGWYDIFNLGEVGNFQGMQTQGGSAQARSGAHMVMYATCHACPASTAVGDIDYGPGNTLNLPALELSWFDHWLKGADNGVQSTPAVKLFVMEPPDTGTAGTGFWVTGPSFPLPGTTGVNYYLASNGHANTLGGDGGLATAPATGKAADRYLYNPLDPVPTIGGNMCCINGLLPSGAFDQRTAEQRPDVLVYTSAPLTTDEVVAGHVTVTLWATSSARDTDFTAKLVDVHPDGFAQNIADGIIRARYRASLTDPTLITPGARYEYTIDLGNTAVVFKAGHQIRLEISSSNFPHYDRNPNTGATFAQTAQVQTATQTILHTGIFQSYLTLPVAPVPVPATP
jgi:uncharacterized protein